MANQEDMKYRRLSLAELEELEGEFIQFLASNTVTGPDWQQLKLEEPEKAEGLIEVFSDVVFDKIIAGIEYMEFKTKEDIKTFHCLSDKIIMNGLKVDNAGELDLRADIATDKLMAALKQTGAKMQIYTAEKGYQPDREQELFRMLEGGALISREGTLFKTIEAFKG